MYKLGRIVVKDTRDYDFLLTLKQVESSVNKSWRYWNANGWWGNQGRTSQCVGFSWSHWLEDGPVTHGGVPPIIKPQDIYYNAQKLDSIEGEDYDGTTVRAGAKYIKSLGYISEYKWCYDLNTLINTILNCGPVVLGTWWFNSMYQPDSQGFIKVGGMAVGGHAYVCNGVNVSQEKFRIKNSWGREWGFNGHAYMLFEDMEKLLRWDGEACLATEINYKE